MLLQSQQSITPLQIDPKPNYPQFNNNVNMPNFNTRNSTTRRKKGMEKGKM